MSGVTLEREKDTLNEDPHLQKKKKIPPFIQFTPMTTIWIGGAALRVQFTTPKISAASWGRPHLTFTLTFDSILCPFSSIILFIIMK